MFLAKMTLIRVKNANMNEGHFHMKGLKPGHILKLKQKITCKIAYDVASEYLTQLYFMAVTDSRKSIYFLKERYFLTLLQVSHLGFRN